MIQNNTRLNPLRTNLRHKNGRTEIFTPPEAYFSVYNISVDYRKLAGLRPRRMREAQAWFQADTNLFAKRPAQCVFLEAQESKNHYFESSGA
jgi:hypothetical protein